MRRFVSHTRNNIPVTRERSVKYVAPGNAQNPFAEFNYPLLLTENWNYASGQLSLNAAPWNTSSSSWQVLQNNYINIVDAIGGISSTANLTASPAYLPNKSYGMNVSLISAHADTVQVNFDIGLASQWSFKWNADTPGTQVTFNGGGVGADGQTFYTGFTPPPTRATLWQLDLKIRVAALSNGNRYALVVASQPNTLQTAAFTRNLKSPTANTGQNFSFSNTTNLQDTGTDSCRVSAFRLFGSLT